MSVGHHNKCLEAIGDKAVQTLVPAIDILNFGTCGTITIPVPDHKSADDAGKAGALVMIKEIGRISTENCANSEGDTPTKVPADHARQILVYPDGFWH